MDELAELKSRIIRLKVALMEARNQLGDAHDCDQGWAYCDCFIAKAARAADDTLEAEEVTHK